MNDVIDEFLGPEVLDGDTTFEEEDLEVGAGAGRLLYISRKTANNPTNESGVRLRSSPLAITLKNRM